MGWIEVPLSSTSHLAIDLLIRKCFDSVNADS
jgi:hypothetical protein